MYYLDMGLMTQCYILGYNWSEAQVTFPDMMWNNNIIITEIRTFLLISNLQFVLTIDRVQIIIRYGSDYHMFDMLPYICSRSSRSRLGSGTSLVAIPFIFQFNY